MSANHIMPDIVTASPTNDVSGVVKTPPTMIRGAIKAAVAEALASIPPERNGYVEVAVGLDTGVNIVTAFKTDDGKWTSVSWFGSDWSGNLTAGTSVKVSF